MEDEFIEITDIIGSKKKGIKPLIPVSRSTWFAGVKDGVFPKPIRLGERRTVWLKSELLAFIEKLKAER